MSSFFNFKPISIHLLLMFLCMSQGMHAAIWDKARGEMNGWKELDWLGSFKSESCESNWIFHAEHGWLYTEQEDYSDGIWFWSEAVGWFWTSEADYPELFLEEGQAWISYLPGSKDPRWFYDQETQTWFTDAPNNNFAPEALMNRTFDFESESELSGELTFLNDGSFILKTFDTVEGTHILIEVRGSYTYQKRTADNNQADLSLSIEAYELLSNPIHFKGSPLEMAHYLEKPVETHFQLHLEFNEAGDAFVRGHCTLTNGYELYEFGNLTEVF